jgi:hypothetical protein
MYLILLLYSEHSEFSSVNEDDFTDPLDKTNAHFSAFVVYVFDGLPQFLSWGI